MIMASSGQTNLFVVLTDNGQGEDNIELEGVFTQPDLAVQAALEWLVEEGIKPDQPMMLHVELGTWTYINKPDSTEVYGFVIEVVPLNISVSRLEQAVRMPTMGSA
jgi:hypothetical protein